MIWLADMKCSFLQLFTLNKTSRRASALPEEDDNFINIAADVQPALLRNSERCADYPLHQHTQFREQRPLMNI